MTGSYRDEAIGFSQFTQSFKPHCDPRVDSASNRNEYQESLYELKRRQRIGLTSPPSVSRLSRTVGSSTFHNPMGLHNLLQG
jgi:hypothetical protein